MNPFRYRSYPMNIRGAFAILVGSLLLSACGGGSPSGSQGMTSASVPNVVGSSQTAVAETIKAAGLTVGTVTTKSSSSVPAGFVISESPAAGTSVATTSAVNLVVSSGSGPTAEIINEHALAQTGLAIGLASTVLQSQVQVLVTLYSANANCTALTGGGSAQYNATSKRVTVYYDSACNSPYIVAAATLTQTTLAGGNVQDSIVETATYYGTANSVIGTLTLNEVALNDASTNDIQLNGLGVFTPASGAQTPVQLGLYCTIPSAGASVPCAGGIAQDLPALGIAIGSVTPLTLTVNTAVSGDPVSFIGTSSTVDSGAIGSLTLTAPSATSMVVTGGTSFTSYASTGSAAAFSLFPPTPTSWMLTDAAGNLRLQVSVVDNTTRNLAVAITQTPSGTAMANGTLDQSGTGTITYSDGTSVAVTSWTLAN
jgi:hypothetical protein